MIVCTFVGVQDCVGASSLARDRPKSHEHWSLTSKDVSSVMCLIDSLWLSVYCISMKKTLFWTSKLYWKATEYRAIFSPSLHTASFPSLLAASFWRVGSWVVRWMAVRPVEWVLWQQRYKRNRYHDQNNNNKPPKNPDFSPRIQMAI